MPSGLDPPDLLSGRGLGIELTELVDEKEIGRAKRIQRGVPDRLPYRDWSSRDLREALRERIEKKDNKALKNPNAVAELWLVIHTDEPGLSPDGVAAALGEWVPVVCKQISRCYFMMSYFPERGRPLFPLPVSTPA